MSTRRGKGSYSKNQIKRQVNYDQQQQKQNNLEASTKRLDNLLSQRVKQGKRKQSTRATDKQIYQIIAKKTDFADEFIWHYIEHGTFSSKNHRCQTILNGLIIGERFAIATQLLDKYSFQPAAGFSRCTEQSTLSLAIDTWMYANTAQTRAQLTQLIEKLIDKGAQHGNVFLVYAEKIISDIFSGKPSIKHTEYEKLFCLFYLYRNVEINKKTNSLYAIDLSIKETIRIVEENVVEDDPDYKRLPENLKKAIISITNSEHKEILANAKKFFPSCRKSAREKLRQISQIHSYIAEGKFEEFKALIEKKDFDLTQIDNKYQALVTQTVMHYGQRKFFETIWPIHLACYKITQLQVTEFITASLCLRDSWFFQFFLELDLDKNHKQQVVNVPDFIRGLRILTSAKLDTITVARFLVSYENLEFVKYVLPLLTNNIKALIKTGFLLHLATVNNKDPQVLEYLLSRIGSEVDCKDEHGNTALLCLANIPLNSTSKEEHLQKVTLLLGEGASLNATNSSGESALQLFAKNARKEIYQRINEFQTDLMTIERQDIECPKALHSNQEHPAKTLHMLLGRIEKEYLQAGIVHVDFTLKINQNIKAFNTFV